MKYSKEFYDALDISSSCFVFASAGSGKTKILVDRYIKFLYMGISPREILCITFTNAAVFEMQSRISSILRRLAVDIDYAMEYLTDILCIKDITSKDIDRIQNLFFQFEDNLYDINIVTIHSFCQDLIGDYPMESGISPIFRIIDTNDSLEIIEESRKNVFRRYIDDGIDTHFVSELSRLMSSYSFNEFLCGILVNNSKFRLLFERYTNIDDYRLKLEKIFNIGCDEEFPIGLCDKVLKLSQNQNIEEIFFTKSGTTIRKRIKIDGFSEDDIRIISDILLHNREISNKRNLISKTYNFLRISKDVYDEYQSIKCERGLLDFLDVIHKANFLITKSFAKDFIISRLGSRIHHIMIDEAQDMSFDQWGIVSNIFDEIFMDQSLENTLFVVGDIKQSIYRFQDASPKEYIKFYNHCSNVFSSMNRRFHEVYLTTSYRSLRNILVGVDDFFDGKYDDYAFSYDNNPIEYKRHKNFRDEDPGIFEMKNLEDTDSVVDFIKYLINERKINDKDIMILMRNRNTLFFEIMEKLLENGIDVLGSNRIDFSSSLIIQDILGIVEFLIDRDDRYALFCMIKSSYIFENNMTDNDIYRISMMEGDDILCILKEYSIEHYDIISSIIEDTKYLDTFSIFFYIAMNIVRYTNKYEREIVDIFLNYIQKYITSKNNNENLRECLSYFKRSSIEFVSSDNNNKSSGVVLTTIHSSKGLESKVVVLIDFSSTCDKNKINFIWNDDMEDPLFLIRPSLKDSFKEVSFIVDDFIDQENRELLRLLYVAMTRARDELYICGPFFKDGVYNMIYNNKNNDNIEGFCDGKK